MKRHIKHAAAPAILLSAVLLTAVLCGCAPQEQAEERVRVTVEETDGCTVTGNGILVAPGGDAVFDLQMERGYALARTDYPGDSTIETDGQTVTLTLKDVSRPTRVRLELTSRYCTLTYLANGGTGAGGSGEKVIQQSSLTWHPRPNTSTGAELFTREGYTLTGWNTASDGSGEEIGLGSRVTVPGNMRTLYAQWAKWSDPALFSWSATGEGAVITAYSGGEDQIVIPGELGGLPVTAIASGAFRSCAARRAILPPGLVRLEEGAFQNCALRELVLFDDLAEFGDGSFTDCPQLMTLRVNAVEAPYGYSYRKESCYADKVDLLICSQERDRVVFYGGCSMWYNLDGAQAVKALGDRYTVVDLGLNGTVNSAVQMQIMGAYLHEGDVLFHTPELSSKPQLMTRTGMAEWDSVLWCGLENNYDLLALADLRTLPGLLDSFCHYLSMKDGRTTYQQTFQDDQYQTFMDGNGCIPFYRGHPEDRLADHVGLDPAAIDDEGMEILKGYYDWYQSKGVRVYLSYACVNMDAVPEEERGNVELMDALFREAVAAMDGPVLVSRLEDYLYRDGDFFDTNYHLLTAPAQENTRLWLRDLLAQMERDGLGAAA